MRFRVTELRVMRELTQAELAHLAETRSATISELEAGKSNPRMDTLEKVASALDVHVVDLFVDDKSDPSATMIAKRLMSLDEEARKSLLNLMNLADPAP